MNKLNKIENSVFLSCRFSLFLKDPFSRLFRGRKSCRCFCVELVKPIPVHRYSIDIFFISYLSYQLHCCALPDKRCLSHGMLPLLSGHDDVSLFK